MRAVSDFYGRADAALDAAEAKGEALLPSLGEGGAESGSGSAAAAAAERCQIWEGHGVALIRLSGDSPVGEPKKPSRVERHEAARRVLQRLVDAGEGVCGQAAADAQKWV